jgi:hypothetical protein
MGNPSPLIITPTIVHVFTDARQPMSTSKRAPQHQTLTHIWRSCTTEMVMQAMTASSDGYQPLAIETTVAKENDPASYWVSPEGQ